MTAAKALEGMTAIVTGASLGIGAGCAQSLAEDGAAVLLMARRPERLDQTRAELLANVPGARVEIFVGDALEEADVKAALAKAHAMSGRLDIIVANVGGIKGFMPLLLQDAETLSYEYRLNVVSTFLMIRHGVPLMQPGGSIVCISSMDAVKPFAGLGSYCAAKAALDMLVKAAAEELGSAQIRVNAVLPGIIRTAVTADMFTNKPMIDAFLEQIPLGRTGDPVDVGRAVRFLAGPESAFITGQRLAADGGQTLRRTPEFTPFLDQMFGKDVMDQVRAGKPPTVAAGPSMELGAKAGD